MCAARVDKLRLRAHATSPSRSLPPPLDAPSGNWTRISSRSLPRAEPHAIASNRGHSWLRLAVPSPFARAAELGSVSKAVTRATTTYLVASYRSPAGRRLAPMVVMVRGVEAGTLRRPLFKSGVLSGCPGTRTRSVASKRASSSFWAGVASVKRKWDRDTAATHSPHAVPVREPPSCCPLCDTDTDTVGGFSSAAHKWSRHRELRHLQFGSFTIMPGLEAR